MIDIRVEKLKIQLEAILINHSNKDDKKHGRAQKIKRAIAYNDNQWHCALCGVNFNDISEITLDHVTPKRLDKRKTGDNTFVVYQIAHQECNKDRSNMPIILFQMFRVIQKKSPMVACDKFTNKDFWYEKSLRAKKGITIHHKGG